MENLFFLTQVGFVAVTFIYFGLALSILKSALNKTNIPVQKRTRLFNRTIIVLVLWAIITGVLAATGSLSVFTLPPRLLIVLIVPLAGLVLISRTATAKEILLHVPPEKIVYLQSFRIFVELLLWALFLDKIIPEQMTFEGQNFDVLSGLTALVVGYLVHRRLVGRTFMYIWNIACLLLLVNIVTVAVLSAPFPFRVFMNEPANTIVTKFPVVWLPALLVPLAYWLNVLSLMQWRKH